MVTKYIVVKDPDGDFEILGEYSEGQKQAVFEYLRYLRDEYDGEGIKDVLAIFERVGITEEDDLVVDCVKRAIKILEEYSEAINEYEDLDGICQFNKEIASRIKQAAIEGLVTINEIRGRGTCFYHVNLSRFIMSEAKRRDLISEDLEWVYEIETDGVLRSPEWYFGVWEIE